MTNTKINAVFAERRFLTSSAVMKVFGYKNRPAFHEWVRNSGVPHIRMNSRRILFDETQLAEWIESRSVGKAAA